MDRFNFLKIRWVYGIALVLLCFICVTELQAKPRFPFPATPDEVGQNDRDLDDDINFIRDVLLSSGSLASGSTQYIQNSSSLQSGARFNVSSATITSLNTTTIRAPGSVLTIATHTIFGTFGTELRIENNALVSEAGSGVGFSGNTTSSSMGNWNGPLIFLSGNDGSSKIERMRIDTSGRVTQPYQPCFMAVSTGATNITGDNTNYTVNYNSEIYDVGSNYNNATFTFTAPVSGKYLFSANVNVEGVLSTHAERTLQIVTSSRFDGYLSEYSLAETNHDLAITAIEDLAANDTVFIRLRLAGSTKVVDIRSANTGFSHFMGCLMN